MPTLQEEIARLKRQLVTLDEARVRVAVFGQPGAGKSSLINALSGQDLAEVGVHTDTTVQAHEYVWQGVELVDLPGYDTKRFPKQTFIEQFSLAEFDVCIWVTDGKLRETDVSFYELAKRELGRPVIAVRSKVDMLWQKGMSDEELRERVRLDLRSAVADATLEVVFVSARTGQGFDRLAALIHECLDSAKRERWERSAKAYSEEALEQKRKACERYILLASAVAAANGVNPVPGLDTAIDLSVLMHLLSEIRAAYGFEGRLNDMGALFPLLAPQVAKVLQVASKEGALVLLRRFATDNLIRGASKLVPLVGPVVSGALGFLVVRKVGNYYLEQCHELALSVLETEMRIGQGRPQP